MNDVKAGRDEGLTPLTGVPQRHRATLSPELSLLLRKEQSQRRHIALAAVALLRLDHQTLLLALAIKNRILRIQIDADGRGDGWRIVRKRRLRAKRTMLACNSLVSSKPLCRRCAAPACSIFSRSKLSAGHCGLMRAAIDLARRAMVIAVRSREPNSLWKPSLPASGPVTTALVAAGGGKIGIT